MDYKKYLIEGFCPVDKYHCLMPVEYESYEEDGAVAGYHKKRMVCRQLLIRQVILLRWSRNILKSLTG